ncbi:hypothetical protein BT96DRAFT_919678 [Gymnopus androsaceus JB14]|uniref:Uncharacterized protein n=1 Tax=Gymnopus androsaceus JB14 TaxID=1447944 RepID=A0A6A4HMF9_9AGAR|nr:hypothetical protein BT96DRAFT_919678 [Gymnopus androsaceus JB14]
MVGDNPYIPFEEWVPIPRPSPACVSFWRGYALLFKFISGILDGSLGLPFDNTHKNASFGISSVADIVTKSKSLLDDISTYLEQGGRIAYVFDAITQSMVDSLEGSDFEDAWEEDEKWTGLPRCDNDEKFDLVRQNIGLDPAESWGPYYNEDDEDEDDEDEDEDEDDEDEDDDAIFALIVDALRGW